jgi:hypothetical protein
VFFADYEHDGFKVINDKLVPIKNVDVDEIERNITSVCVEYKETDDSYFKKIKLNSEWAYVLDNDILTNKYLIYNNFSNYEKVYNQRS